VIYYFGFVPPAQSVGEPDPSSTKYGVRIEEWTGALSKWWWGKGKEEGHRSLISPYIVCRYTCRLQQ